MRTALLHQATHHWGHDPLHKLRRRASLSLPAGWSASHPPKFATSLNMVGIEIGMLRTPIPGSAHQQRLAFEAAAWDRLWGSNLGGKRATIIAAIITTPRHRLARISCMFTTEKPLAKVDRGYLSRLPV
ncbi:hypothetical protein ACVWXM_009527 [Bradyrhizobium sp. GM7.3]